MVQVPEILWLRFRRVGSNPGDTDPGPESIVGGGPCPEDTTSQPEEICGKGVDSFHQP